MSTTTDTSDTDATSSEGWRTRLAAAVADQAPPPSGAAVTGVEEDRKGRTGRPCRECGDVGASVVLDTAVFTHTATTGAYEQAIYEGDLADLLDEIEAGTLRLDWVRLTL